MSVVVVTFALLTASLYDIVYLAFHAVSENNVMPNEKLHPFFTTGSHWDNLCRNDD